MHESHLLDYWKIIKRRKVVAIAFFALLVGMAAGYAILATPVYEGVVRIFMDTEKNQTLDFGDRGAAIVQRRDVLEYFNTQKEFLASRLYADRLARKLKLDKHPYFIAAKAKNAEKAQSGLGAAKQWIARLLPQRGRPALPGPDPNLGAELDPEITNILLENLSCEAPQQNNIMKITFDATDPAVAAAIANGAATTLIENNLALQVKPYQDAAEWLSARIVESKEKVAESEKQLQRYREGKGVVSFESRESILTQQLQEIVTQLVQTESRRQEAEVKYNLLQSVIDSPERLASVPEIAASGIIQELRKRELDLKRELSELSEKFGPKHPQIIRLKSQTETVQKSITAEARKMLDNAKTEYEIAKNREVSLRRTLEQQKQEVLELSRKAIDFNVIAGETASNRQFYDLLLKRLQQAKLSSGINLSNLQIVDFAVTPKEPVKPRRGIILALAVFMGLVGGLFFAFLADYLDSSIRTAADVEKYLKLPFFAAVPLSKEKSGALFMSANPTSIVAEAFRTIRTGVLLATIDKPARVILLTSAIPNEGKTTVSANLALTLAQNGERVVVVDTDLRRRNLHLEFGFEPEPGLTNLLQNSNLPGVVRVSGEHPNLFVLTGGSQAPNPLELLGSARMKECLGFLRERFDRVILDAPPLHVFSDSLVLSKVTDGVILVVSGSTTPRPLAQQAAESLLAAKANVLGVVINKADVGLESDYSHYYYSYYAGKKGAKRKRAR